MRSLTPVEAAIGVALGASLLATMLPTFFSNLHASRMVEPVDGLNRIATRATAIAAARAAANAYPESVPLTPAEVPKGERVTDPAGTWDHPTWRELSFSLDVPHSYSFSFTSKNAKGRAVFSAEAHGDLDGDGVLSDFRIDGESRDGAEPSVKPMIIHREVE